jgi:hypothetical protein
MFVDHLSRADLSREQLQRVFDEQIEKMFRLIDDQLRKLEISHPRENIVRSQRGNFLGVSHLLTRLA